MSVVKHNRLVLVALFTVLGGLIVPSRLLAQPPCPCPPAEDAGTWIGTAGAGLALTSGNSDTLNFNLAFDVTRDPKTRNLMKWKGLFIRGEQEGSVVANRLSLAFRDQYTLDERAFAYAQVDYLRDTFKLIDYLVAPTVGIGYKVVDTMPTRVAVDAGVGAVWEKNPDRDVRTALALTAGERFDHVLTSTATLRHVATALWKANDLADGLYTISIGVSAKLSNRLQLSVDLLDTFKNQPPTRSTKKNDVALVTAITTSF
jgi:putative salt-induced outer membrane protein YdiY